MRRRRELKALAPVNRPPIGAEGQKAEPSTNSVTNKTAAKKPSSPPSTQPQTPAQHEISTEPAGEAFEIPSPFHLLAILRPDVKPHPWQIEELLRLGGFLDPKNLDQQIPITAENPYLLNLAAANGSGKDEFIIATFNVWFAMRGRKNLSVNTSSSFEQLKYQTEAHIKELTKAANKLFSPIFQSREFYHVCAPTGSEIKLFATDEAGRAEGYHPRSGGQMAIVINEAKSVDEPIFEALSRCTGYSYWLNISSPGIKSGQFYRDSKESIFHPDRPQLGRGYFRRISAYDCPHIPRVHIENQIKNKPKEWVDSSIRALFTDFGQSTVVSHELWFNKTIPQVKSNDQSIVLGGDLAAGGDECSFYLRRGSTIIDRYFFTQADTTLTAELIDTRFRWILAKPYQAIFDDGGVGKAIIDGLVKLGWSIRRKHNQAAATDKRVYLNFGAESYFHLRNLIENGLHRPSLDDVILNRQITSRIYDTKEQGKFRLEDKKLHRSRTRESPDRADAYVLCFSSMPVELHRHQAPTSQPTKLSLEEAQSYSEKLAWGEVLTFENYGKRPRRSCIVPV